MKTYKYNVGDVVKVDNVNCGSSQTNLCGKIGIIIKQLKNSTLDYDIKFINDVDWTKFNIHSFEESHLKTVKEYIPVQCSIDKWIQNPEFKSIYDSLEAEYN